MTADPGDASAYPTPRPTGPGQPGRPGQHTEPGPLALRFVARLIDGIIVGLVGLLLEVVFRVTGDILITGLFSGLLTFIYFVVFEVTQGWTPAKKLFGLSVRGPGGAAKPSLAQSAIRNAFTLLAIVPYIGGLLAVIAYVVIAVTIHNSPTKQGKHDELAGGTQVVKD